MEYGSRSPTVDRQAPMVFSFAFGRPKAWGDASWRPQVAWMQTVEKPFLDISNFHFVSDFL